MDAEPSNGGQRLAGLRPVLAAVVASLVVVGAIIGLTDSNGGHTVALSSTVATTVAPLSDASATSTTLVGSGATVTSLSAVDVPLSIDAAIATAPLVTDAPLVSGEEPDAAPSVATTGATGVDPGAATSATSGVGAAVPAATDPAERAEIPAGVGLPSVSAKAYAVYDATHRTWLAGNQADAALPVGSVMKLLTSYVVLQAGDLAKVVTVPPLEVDAQESSIGLYTGEQLPRDVLFRAMLIVSANDAARSLAIDVGGTTNGFVQMMNASASQLGLTSTVAANPIGLDAAGAHSSARDVITLGALLMQNSTFREAVAKPIAHLHGQTFKTTNALLTDYQGADGIKTGHTTDAGYCLVGSATRDGLNIIVAVLGSSSEAQRVTDASALLDWAFAQP